MTKHTVIALLLASTMLTACAVQSTSGGTAPDEAKGGLFGLASADDLQVETAGAFKDKKEVVIGSFQISFLEEKKASKKAGGGLMGNGFGGKSSAHLELTGLDTARFQAITEAAYADFVKKLQAAGYSVTDRTALANHEDFKGVSSEASPQREESSFFGSSVTQTTVAPKAIDRIYAGGFGFSNSLTGAAVVAEKTKVPVLFVTYTVDFANAGGHGGAWTMTSSVEVGQGISVPPGGGVTIVGGHMGTFSSAVGSVKLGQPVYSKTTFGEVVGTTSDAAVGLEAAVNVIGALGGVGTNQSRSFEVKANPAKYSEVTTKVLGDANSKLVDKMAALR